MNKCRAGLVWVMLMLSIPGAVYAQVLDNFGDGDFSQNPHWQGDSLHFIINTDGQLQLNSSGTDTSCLSLPSQLFDSTEWRFWINLAFSPSANNYARVYLVSDQADLNGPLNAYFLQFGQAGSNDAITFYRQENLDTFRICTGSPGLIAAGFSGNVKVTRKKHGKWTISITPIGSIQFSTEAEGTDTTFSPTGFFGIQCRFTASNATKFYFDDFIVREILQDLEPPSLVKVIARDSLSLDVFISESIDWQHAGITQHYSVDKDIGSPLLALPDNQQTGVIHLQFQQAFQQAVQYTLSISEIQDIAGNITYNQAIPFICYSARQHDIVFNEVMADPDPPVGLPPVEYVELYNRTDHPLFLKEWHYSWGTSTTLLPDSVINPKSYLLLCNKGTGILLAPFGNYIEINGFSLPNSGGSLSLRNTEASTIACLEYSPDWIINPLKKDGGWALEQIDPFNPCGGGENWRESNASAGGTPGGANSVLAAHPDQLQPRALRAYPINSFTIRVLFSESLDSASLLQSGMFRLDPGKVYPAQVVLKAPAYRQLELVLADSLQADKTYTLHFLHQFVDCAGNASMGDDSLRVAIPGMPQPGDIIINEILFHPKSGGSEFAELYNMSAKALDLKDLVIGTYDSLAQIFDSYGRISEESNLIFPGDYVVLADKPEAVLQQYMTLNPDAILQSLFFPTLTDAGAILALGDISLNVIDKAPYSESMHYPLLANTTGVSLEKIRPDAKSEDRSSWHSAASGCGYATPAYRNSQELEFIDEDVAFSLQPRVFSPGDDGKKDLIILKYQLDNPGYMMNVTIFNEAGMRVKTLVNNELLATSGFFVWNGLSDRQTLCTAGNYLCYIEIFNAVGNVKRVKRVFAISGF